MELPNFPSNSNASKERKELPVLEYKEGEAGIKKKTYGQRFLESFSNSGKSDSILRYIFKDLLEPTLKQLLYNIVSGSLSMYLFDRVETPNMYDNRRPGHVPVNMYNNYQKISERASSKSTDIIRGYDVFDLDSNLWFQTQELANQFVIAAKDWLRETKRLTVADVYKIMRQPIDNTQADYFGWYELPNIYVYSGNDKYFYVKMPRPYILDDRG